MRLRLQSVRGILQDDQSPPAPTTSTNNLTSGLKAKYIPDFPKPNWFTAIDPSKIYIYVPALAPTTGGSTLTPTFPSTFPS